MILIKTYQDFIELRKAGEASAIQVIINEWKSGKTYKTAVLADCYDRQENDTIMNYVKKIFSLSGMEIQDFTASNNKVVSNFFARFNTQRNTYSLGNGVSFVDDAVKKQFGDELDTTLLDAGYYALIHGVSFPYWNGKCETFFKATEFAPLWDEETGRLSAGIRFWQLDADKPLFAVVYEKDGFRKWRKADGEFEAMDEKQAYIQEVQTSEVDGDEVIGAYNYSDLPIVPFWGSRLHQSTLIGMRSKIDSYDLIRSGFANDLTDVSQIYWILENYGGMSDKDLARFRDKLKLTHIAEADTSEGGKVTPYAQDIPHQARQTYLDGIKKDLYEDFGALDVHSLSADSTNDHIEAAYQPLDENADDYESQIIKCVQALGAIIGLEPNECVPLFKRNRISNQAQMMEMLAQADWLDTETKIRKTPFVTVDEVATILERQTKEDTERMSGLFAE